MAAGTWGVGPVVATWRGRAADETGMTSVEYGLLAGFLGVVFIAAGPLLAEALLWLRDVILYGMVGS
jgi:Flp pilus assembly pilin Flp